MPAWPTSEPGARPLYSGELQLALRDLAHPAQRVRGGRGERVRAQRHHLDADLRQLQPPRLERGDVREGRVGLHHHGAVGLAAGEPLADRRLPHVERRGEPGDEPVEVLGVLGDEHDVERGAVAHEDLALAVEEGAAGRGEGHEARAVVLRQVAEVARADHLQVPELDDESGDEHHRQGLQDGEAGLDDPQVLVDPHRPSPGRAHADRASRRSTRAKSSPPARAFRVAREARASGREARRLHREDRGEPLHEERVRHGGQQDDEGAGGGARDQEAPGRPARPRSRRASFDERREPEHAARRRATSWTQPAAAPASMPWVSPPASAQ